MPVSILAYFYASDAYWYSIRGIFHPLPCSRGQALRVLVCLVLPLPLPFPFPFPFPFYWFLLFMKHGESNQESPPRGEIELGIAAGRSN